MVLSENFHISGKLVNKKCDVCCIHTVLINSAIENELRPKHIGVKHIICSIVRVLCTVLCYQLKLGHMIRRMCFKNTIGYFKHFL